MAKPVKLAKKKKSGNLHIAEGLAGLVQHFQRGNFVYHIRFSHFLPLFPDKNPFVSVVLQSCSAPVFCEASTMAL